MRKEILILALAGGLVPAGFAREAAKATVQAANQPGEKVPSEDPVLPDFHALDLGSTGIRLYRSGSPVRALVRAAQGGPADPRQARQVLDHIKALGIRTIISLEEPASEEQAGQPNPAVQVERNAARDAGLTFLSHPMANARFKDMPAGEVLAWLKAVEADILASGARGGVLVHCSAGHDRTGLVAAYLRITVDRWTAERAIAEMRDLGHNWPKFSSNGGVSSWHEDFLRVQFGAVR